MLGGLGDDIYVVNSASDIIVENPAEGEDLVVAYTAYSIAALPNVEHMRLAGSAVFATGNSGANELQGNAVANSIIGNAGNDTLFGAGGDDTLNGSAGNDVLFGGTGADAFTFSATGVSAANADTIMDFNAAEGDHLDLNDANFTAIGATGGFSPGDPRFYSAIGASQGHDADDRIIYDSGSGQLYYDPDGDGATSAVPIFTLASAPELQDVDIFVI